eukprot:TCONS_00014898-protein
MDVIMEGEGMETGDPGNQQGGTIQIHAQAYVNIGIPDDHKSIAEKESEVLSLIILNNQGDNGLPNVQITENVDHLEHHNVQGVVAGGNMMVGEEQSNENNEAAEAIERNEDLVVDNDEVAFEEQEQLAGTGDFAVTGDSTMITMEFHAADAAWITLLDRFELLMNDNRIRGYVEGEKQFLCLWESFQSSTMSTFVVRSSDKFYKMANERDENAIQGRILRGKAKWSRTPLVQYDGVPFVSIERKYFGCRLGGTERQNARKGQFKTKRNGHSVKVGCPADADVLEVWRVPSLTVPDNIKVNRERRRVKTQLLSHVFEHIRSGDYVKRFYVTLPLITKHQNHPVLDTNAGRLKIVHPRIIEKIHEIVQQGISEKRVVKYMLEEFVQDIQTELGIEIQESDRSYYPTDRDINNHIRNALTLVKKEESQALENSELPDLTSEPLSYSTEVVGPPSFVSIPTACEMNLDLNDGSTSAIYQTSSVDQSENTTTATFVETTMVDPNNSSYSETKNFLSSHEVTTLEDIVQNGVLQYYTQNSAGNIEVAETTVTETPEDSVTVENTDPQNDSIENTLETDATVIKGETSTEEVVEIPKDSEVSSDVDVNILIEHCKRNPNPPPIAHKKKRKWAQRNARSMRKHLDMKTLLKSEIGNSFAIINQALANENDEAKLKLVLKKVKLLQRIIQGKDLIKRRGRKVGIHSMISVSMDNEY